MTEERLETAMEYFGDAVEKTVEGAADVFDKSMNFARRFRPVRFVGKTLAFLTGFWLIANAATLAEKGNQKMAKVLLISGILVIAIQFIEMALFRKGKHHVSKTI